MLPLTLADSSEDFLDNAQVDKNGKIKIVSGPTMQGPPTTTAAGTFVVSWMVGTIYVTSLTT